MTFKKEMQDYIWSTISLKKSFNENLSKAKDLVVANSPVDYGLYTFICSVYFHRTIATALITDFLLRAIKGSELRKGPKSFELIKRFNLLEEKLATHNDFLEEYTEALRTLSEDERLLVHYELVPRE